MTPNIFLFFGFGVCFEMGKKPAPYFPSLWEERGLVGHWRSMFFETCLLKINFGTCTNWLENIGQPFLSFFLFLVLSLSFSISLCYFLSLFIHSRSSLLFQFTFRSFEESVTWMAFKCDYELACSSTHLVCQSMAIYVYSYLSRFLCTFS